ncbi:hypothetical protein H257_07784 [Aphanomyces astaci]|uniref:Uncharacterized protein n=1 Tax=Aphanomyces astaci TaxID=112090 RepID=W4GI72_APHAT|nr:hypothetical protein H257_07784 [Aphanomyces astaci]ETV78996.1 hypothetical protein H257_07784 [Aphanomyces astaci]|eukprot:XP_009831715.1 hypothetical protein H257_07784 [Aphanomyces astaci]
MEPPRQTRDEVRRGATCALAARLALSLDTVQDEDTVLVLEAELLELYQPRGDVGCHGCSALPSVLPQRV